MPVNPMRLILVMLTCFVGFCFSETPAAAQNCTYSVTPMAYGTVSLSSGAAIDTTATLTASCNGAILSTVMICPNIGDGSGGGSGGNRTLESGANDLSHQLYSNAGRTTIWGSAVWPYSPRPPKLTVSLGVLGSGSNSWTIYGRILAGQASTQPGTYSSVFSSGHVSFRVRYNDSSSCNSAIGTASANQPNFTVSATVQPTCTVTTTDVDFGSEGVLDAAVNASGSVRVTCSSGAPWEIDLTVPGGETATTRTMSKGAETVTYGLYKDTGRTQPWGDTGTQSMTGTGTGALQNIPVYGRVPPQPTPSAGNYSDTVVVTVTY